MVAIRRVTVTGYCSVEGIFQNNEILSRRRAETLRDVIRYRYQGSAFTLETRYMGEDWAGLRRLLETAEINYRRTMLDIIDHVDVMRGRERQLMQVGGGYPYREMKQTLSRSCAGRRLRLTTSAASPSPSASRFRQWSLPRNRHHPTALTIPTVWRKNVAAANSSVARNAVAVWPPSRRALPSRAT